MNKYMRMAIKEAEKGISHGHGGPFGAVIVKDGVVIGVLDVDSENLATFDETDALWLEKVAQLIAKDF